MRRATCAALALLAGCAGPRTIDRPQAGYQALRFNREVLVHLPLATTFVISPGTVLVGDKMDDAGRTLFCGMMGRAVGLDDTSSPSQVVEGCVELRGSSVIMRNGLGSEFSADLEPGAVSQTRS